MPLLFALAFLDLLMGLMALLNAIVTFSADDLPVAIVIFVFGAILFAGSQALGPRDSRPLYSRRAWLALAVQCVLLTQTIIADYVVIRQSVQWQSGNAFLNLTAGTVTILSLITIAELRGWKLSR